MACPSCRCRSACRLAAALLAVVLAGRVQCAAQACKDLVMLTSCACCLRPTGAAGAGGRRKGRHAAACDPPQHLPAVERRGGGGGTAGRAGAQPSGRHLWCPHDRHLLAATEQSSGHCRGGPRWGAACLPACVATRCLGHVQSCGCVPRCLRVSSLHMHQQHTAPFPLRT
jgi:hypothetical protein